MDHLAVVLLLVHEDGEVVLGGFGFGLGFFGGCFGLIVDSPIGFAFFVAFDLKLSQSASLSFSHTIFPSSWLFFCTSP